MMQFVKRFFVLFVFSVIALEVFFVLRIAIAAVLPITSTAFQRTEIVKLYFSEGLIDWRHNWMDYAEISENMKKAVLAAEDSGFVRHHGVEWEAIRGAFSHNQNSQTGQKHKSMRGGSTITQQLAKNIFLSPEQSYLRKGQELLIAYTFEAFLSKEQLLELYLNHAQWGRGVFGAQAASQKYFLVSAGGLDAQKSATLAAILPNPVYYERNYRRSQYLRERATQIMRGIRLVEIP